MQVSPINNQPTSFTPSPATSRAPVSISDTLISAKEHGKNKNSSCGCFYSIYNSVSDFVGATYRLITTPFSWVIQCFCPSEETSSKIATIARKPLDNERVGQIAALLKEHGIELPPSFGVHLTPFYEDYFDCVDALLSMQEHVDNLPHNGPICATISAENDEFCVTYKPGEGPEKNLKTFISFLQQRKYNKELKLHLSVKTMETPFFGPIRTKCEMGLSTDRIVSGWFTSPYVEPKCEVSTCSRMAFLSRQAAEEFLNKARNTK